MEKLDAEKTETLEFDDLSGFQLCHVSSKKGPILREKRVCLGLTQAQVAEKAQIALPQYQKFETDTRNIMTCSFQIACRVIEALGMDISKFYHGDYHIGEEIYCDEEGIKYVKTCKLISADVT